MRKALVVIALLLILAGSAVFILLRLKRRPVPTAAGWRAHVTTVAGDATPRVRDSEQPGQAAFSDPFGIAIAKDGSIYVSDAGESDAVRRINPAGGKAGAIPSRRAPWRARGSRRPAP